MRPFALSFLAAAGFATAALADQPVGLVSFGVGVDERQEAVAEVMVKTSRLFGSDVALSFDGRISRSESDIALSFSAPRAWGDNPAFGVDLGFGRLQGDTTFAFDATRGKAEIYAGWYGDSRASLEVYAGARRVNLSANASTVSAIITADVGERTAGVLGLRVSRDLPDMFAGATGRVTFFAEGLNSDDGRRVLRSRAGIGLQSAPIGASIVRFRAEAGAVSASGTGTRIDERFFLGPEDLRGFALAGVGPRDLATGQAEALGGNYFATARLDVAFPERLGIAGLTPSAFVDVGSVWSLDNIAGGAGGGSPVDDGLDWRGTFGVSLGWEFGSGRLGVHLSHPFLKQAQDRTESLQVTFESTF